MCGVVEVELLLDLMGSIIFATCRDFSEIRDFHDSGCVLSSPFHLVV